MALRTFTHATIWLAFGALMPVARAADVPQSFTLDGQLFSDAAATSPLIDGAIQLTVQVLDEAKTCVLYEETQPVSTLASKGYFTVQVGTAVGSTTRTTGDSGNSMANIFQNISAINGKLLTNGGPCSAAAVGGHRRFVRIAISPSTMGSVARTLSPDLTIDSVPNAIVAERAESLQGLRGTDVLKVNTAAGSSLSQANLESLFTSATRFNSLTAIVDGTSTNYMRSNSNSGAQLPVLPGAPTTPPLGAIWFDSSDSKIKFQTSVGPATLGTGGGSVTSVGFTAPPELTVAGAPVTTAGTIAVTWAAQMTNKVLAAPDGTTGTPTFRVLTANDIPNIPWTKITTLLPTTLLGYGITDAVKNAGGTPSLQSGLDAGKGAASTAGRIWIATDTKLIYRDNGTTWDQIAGASSPTGAAGGDLSGTYPNPGVAKLQGVAVATTVPLDGQILKYASAGTNWAPTNFSIGDLKTATGTQQFAGSAACLSSQTLTWSSLTDTFACSNIAGLDGAVITTGTVAAARLPASASAWTVSGSDVYRASGNVGIGTSNPTATLHVVTGGGVVFERGAKQITFNPNKFASGIAAVISTGTTTSTSNMDLILQSGTDDMATGITIKPTGNVGVGNASPVNKLDVTGTASVSSWMAIGGNAKAETAASDPTLTVYGNLDIAGPGKSLVFYNAGSRTYMNGGGVSSNSGAVQTFALTNSSGYKLAVNAASGGSTISTNGNMSVGSTYYSSAAPTNGLIVEGNVGLGVSDPGSILDISGAQTVREIASASAPVAAAGKTLLYADSSSHTLKVSQNGGAYSDLVTIQSANANYLPLSGGTLTGVLNISPAAVGGPSPMIFSGQSAALGTDNDGADVVIRVGQPSDAAYSAGNLVLADTGGNVGIGTTSPRSALDVSGAITSTASVSNASATVDFISGNIQHTTANCGSFTLRNLKDGGSYMFVVKGTNATTCSFSAFSDAGVTALTVHLPPGHGATTTGKHTIYNLAVSGGDVYLAWTPGY